MSAGRSLLYVSNSNIPSPYANTVQVMNMCHALSGAGLDVDLLAIRGRGDVADAFEAYGLPQSFRVHRLDPPWLRRFGRGWAIARKAEAWVRTAGRRFDCVYTRNPWVRAAGAVTIYESHHLADSKFDPSGRLLARRVGRAVRSGALDRIVCISEELERQWRAHGVPADRLTVLPDAVDVTKFETGLTPEAARAALGWEPRRPLAIYCGALFPERGPRAILQAAALTRAVDFVLIGGTDDAIADTREAARAAGFDHVRVIGRVPHAEVPRHLAAADILLMPYSASWRYAAVASPLKLFEYLAARRPIVASDLPSVREVLSHETAVLIAPDDGAGLAAAVGRLAGDAAARERLAAAGARLVAGRTWLNRAVAIRDLMDRA